MERTYEAALARLSSLQSNLAATSLFSKPRPAPPPSSSSSAASRPSTQDLNALAIPEMLAWLQRANITPRDLVKLKCIHVAGTKGKGSVCAFLTAILTHPTVRPRAGRVGTYTSPHLVSVRERIQLDGEPISRELFARYFFEVWDAFTASARAELASSSSSPLSEEELQGPATKPFYFRFLTILALHAFLREGVASAVVECGIGGEYDATNVLPAEAVTAAVVAQLGIDHVGMLGGTAPEIAWHKAGVCKEGRRCFTRSLEGGDGEEVMRVLRRRAAEKGAELVEVDDAAVLRWGGVRSAEAGSLEGEFQKFNQALAVGAALEHLRVLENSSEPLSPTADSWLRDLPPGFAEGLQSARLKGRCETHVQDDVTWLIDGAHTAESLEEVARWFASKRKMLAISRWVLVFNQQERDAAKMLHGLVQSINRFSAGKPKSVFSHAIFTRNDLQRRGDGEPEPDLSVQRAAAEAMRAVSRETETEISVVDNVGEAVDRVRTLDEAARQDGGRVGVLATGSLHLVGALFRVLEPESEL
ncbi:hypothetical protein DL766_005772 [Monosporascus sp. MC13-8B]|nr:hypothetical protein DL766_005772 [Monosporascus sp. MC13-8B]